MLKILENFLLGILSMSIKKISFSALLVLLLAFGYNSTSFARVGILDTYMDDGKCLLNGNLPCHVANFNSVDDITFYFASGALKHLHLSEGTIFVSYSPGENSAYTRWMLNQNNVSELGRRKLYGNSDYDIKIDGNSKISISLLIESDDKQAQKFATCNQTAPLRLGTQFYVNDFNDKRTINCKIDSGWWPVSLTIKGEMYGEIRKYTETGNRNRFIQVPSGAIKIWGHGCSNWTQSAGCNSSWKDYSDRPEHVTYMSPSYIKLNDRQCNLSMDNLVNFGHDIPSSSMGLIKEIESKMNINCTGYSKTEGGSTDRVSGEGIKNRLYAIKINASETLPNDSTNTTIGLRTDGTLRSDLYVEGSFKKGQDCNVEPLLTNRTPINLPNEIRLDGTGDSQSVPDSQRPSIYWKLCNPTNQSLKTGAFEGQADVSIVYE